MCSAQQRIGTVPTVCIGRCTHARMPIWADVRWFASRRGKPSLDSESFPAIGEGGKAAKPSWNAKQQVVSVSLAWLSSGVSCLAPPPASANHRQFPFTSPP